MGEREIWADRKQQNCNLFSALQHFLMVSFTRNVGCAKNHVPVSTLFTACGRVCVSSVLFCVFQVCCFVRFKRVAVRVSYV